jgi:hypothetical protein
MDDPMPDEAADAGEFIIYASSRTKRPAHDHANTLRYRR